jgi:hypothetical protein
MFSKFSDVGPSCCLLAITGVSVVEGWNVDQCVLLRLEIVSGFMFLLATMGVLHQWSSQAHRL